MTDYSQPLVSTPMASLARAPMSVTTAAPQVTVQVYLDGEQWRGMARTEIDTAFGDLADKLHNAGV